MVKKGTTGKSTAKKSPEPAPVVYCGDNLEQLAKVPDTCVDLIYIDPPFNCNRKDEATS